MHKNRYNLSGGNLVSGRKVEEKGEDGGDRDAILAQVARGNDI